MANYPLQTLILNLPSPSTQLDIVLEELAPCFEHFLGPQYVSKSIELILLDGRIGVVMTLFNLAAKHELLSNQHKLTKLVMKVRLFSSSLNCVLSKVLRQKNAGKSQAAFEKSLAKILLYLPYTPVCFPPFFCA